LNSVFLIINALLPFVLNELEQYKVIDTKLGGLIGGIEGAASSFSSEITNSTGQVSVTATTLLSAISAGLAVMQTQTNVNPVTLSIIQAFDKATAAGLAAYPITTVDPTKLAPIAPIQ
jgi:hypothetical protein